MEKVLLFHPKEKSIPFALAAAIIAGYKVVPASSMEELWDLDADSLVLLDIFPDNPSFVDMNTYSYLQGPRITGVLSLQDVNNVKIQTENKGEGAQEILRRLSRELIADARDVRHPETWEHNNIARRYGEALEAARIQAEHRRNPKTFSFSLIEAAMEIASQKQSAVITALQNYYNSVVKIVTKKAQNKIELNSDLVTVAGREIASCYLHQIAEGVDLDALKIKTLSISPYLGIIQYRQKTPNGNTKEYTWLGSREINLRNLLNLKKGDPHEAILVGPHKTIIRLLRQSFSTLKQ